MSQPPPVSSPGLPRTEDLAWRAATLAERVECARAGRREDEAPGADEALAPWAKAFSLGDGAALRRRLGWDRIEPGLAVQALAGEVCVPTGASWTRWVPAFLDEARACGESLGTPEWTRDLASVTPTPEPPFVEAWLPFLRAARQALADRAVALDRWLTRDAVAALECHLLRQVSAVGELALFDAFERRRGAGPESGPLYRGFVRDLLGGGWADLWSDYPVLARHLSQLTGDWVDSVTDLVSQLDEDRDALLDTFGLRADRVVELVPGLSDRHRGRSGGLEAPLRIRPLPRVQAA